MARFLLSLLLVLGTSDAVAQACYWDGQKLNTTCWACQPGAYPIEFQRSYCPGYQAPTCQISQETRQESCPQNQTGSKTYTRQSSCPDPYGTPIWGPWQITKDTCTWNPPTCQPSTQTQTPSCPAGYTGTITQQQTSACPNPYGSPVWSNVWLTTSNTCVKSISNPTNPTSPVSPLNPTSVSVTPTVPATAPVAPVQMTTQPTDTPEVRTQTPSDAPSAASPAPPPPAVTGAKAASIAQKLELIGALPKQPTIIESLSLTQELPYGLRRQQNLLGELIVADDSWLDRDMPIDYKKPGMFGD